MVGPKKIFFRVLGVSDPVSRALSNELGLNVRIGNLIPVLGLQSVKFHESLVVDFDELGPDFKNLFSPSDRASKNLTTVSLRFLKYSSSEATGPLSDIPLTT